MELNIELPELEYPVTPNVAGDNVEAPDIVTSLLKVFVYQNG